MNNVTQPLYSIPAITVSIPVPIRSYDRLKKVFHAWYADCDDKG